MQLSQKLPHLNFILGEKNILSNMFNLEDTAAVLNLISMEHHQYVLENYNNLVIRFEYLKGLVDLDPFNINGVGRVK